MGCCTSCRGTGAAPDGPCWDCRATGCAHPQPVCPGCGSRPPCDTVWVYQQRFFCAEQCVTQFRKRAL